MNLLELSSLVRDTDIYNNKMRLLTAPYLPEVFEDAATLRSAEDLKCLPNERVLRPYVRSVPPRSLLLLSMPGGSTGLATSMRTGAAARIDTHLLGRRWLQLL